MIHVAVVLEDELASWHGAVSASARKRVLTLCDFLSSCMAIDFASSCRGKVTAEV